MIREFSHSYDNDTTCNKQINRQQRQFRPRQNDSVTMNLFDGKSNFGTSKLVRQLFIPLTPLKFVPIHDLCTRRVMLR